MTAACNAPLIHRLKRRSREDADPALAKLIEEVEAYLPGEPPASPATEPVVSLRLQTPSARSSCSRSSPPSEPRSTSRPRTSRSKPSCRWTPRAQRGSPSSARPDLPEHAPSQRLSPGSLLPCARSGCRRGGQLGERPSDAPTGAIDLSAHVVWGVGAARAHGRARRARLLSVGEIRGPDLSAEARDRARQDGPERPRWLALEESAPPLCPTVYRRAPQNVGR
jgi:hypothetical protein